MNSVVAGMSSILTRMGRVYRVLRRVHHVRVVPLFLAVLFGLLRAVVWFGMLLDRLGVMAEMCVFLEHPMTPELRAHVHELGEKQRKYAPLQPGQVRPDRSSDSFGLRVFLRHVLAAAAG